MRNLLLLRCDVLKHKRPGCFAEGSERHGHNLWGHLVAGGKHVLISFHGWEKKDTSLFLKRGFKMTCIWVLTRFDNSELESDV